MKRIVIMLAALILVAGYVISASADESTYVGVKKCKMCHKKVAAGEQFRLWSESSHANAFATLANEQSMEIAKKMGIDNPQEADECLKCHVTGHGEGELAALILPENGVGCESCHGAGSAYKKKSIMKAIYAGEQDGAALGLVTITEETCTACHNEESPTFEGFNYEERVLEMAHPVPAAE